MIRNTLIYFINLMLKTRWTSKIHFYKVEGKMKKKKKKIKHFWEFPFYFPKNCQQAILGKPHLLCFHVAHLLFSLVIPLTYR